VRVQFMVGGGTTMAVAVPPPAGVDPTQHACATNVLRDAAQALADAEESGIVYVEVALAAR
jgi:hypothetical protein